MNFFRLYLQIFPRCERNLLKSKISFRFLASESKGVTNSVKIEIKKNKQPEKDVRREDEDEEELEEMFIEGPAGLEWGGPTRGGRKPEPTRYGDWERKGRVSDFR